MEVLIPSHDNVLIRRVVEQEKKKGGIVMQESAKEKPLVGTVVAAGPGRQLDNGKVHFVGVKEGDRVMFGKYAGTEVSVNGEKLMLMRDEEILGRLVDRPDETRKDKRQ